MNIGIEQLTIYDLDGNERVTIIPGSNSIYEAELMSKEQLVLKFVLTDPVLFELGDYCECKWGRFELTEPYRPTANSAGGWQYELTMPAHYWKWANKILYYDRQNALECSFSLTHDISHHASLVLSNLAALGYKYNNQDYTVSIDSDVTTELKLISYSNSSITAALNSIAETFECEWWVTDNILHFGHCEIGTEVELAEGDEVNGMSASDSSETYATRFIAFGSTKNLTQSYRPDSEEVVVGSIRDKRLMLPKGTPYIDTTDGLPTEQAVEKVLVFDDIYPKRIGTIATVTTKTYTDEDTSTGTKTEWNAYRFTDTGINFSSDYLLKSSTNNLKVIFQSGKLAGMEFDISFNPDGYSERDSSGAWDSRAQVYEIVRNETYGIKLPNDTLAPAVGDKYVLYNFDISYLSAEIGTDNYIALAEKELLEAAQKQVEKYKVDTKSYSCPINIVRYYGYEEDANGKLVHSTAAELDFALGQKIKLINPAFFADGRTSRVYGFEKSLDGESVTYTVSDNSEYSRLNELSETVDTLAYGGYSYNGITKGSSNGAGIYLITTHDTTPASDSNAYSAARATAQFADKDKAYTDFLRKNVADTATGRITFADGATANELLVTELANIARAIITKAGSETFVDGFSGSGWQVWSQDGEARMTVDRMTIRKAMVAFELLIERIKSVGGQLIVSAANGKVKAVSGSKLTLEDGFGLFKVGDYVRCQTFTGTDIKSYWVQVLDVADDGATLTIDEDGLDGGVPAVGDELVLLGSTDATRQNAITISATEDGQPRVDILNGISGPALSGCLRCRLGNLDGISDAYFPTDAQPQGDGLYSDNAYLHGTFVLADGQEVSQLFELMNGKLRSVISENWETHNLLANGWLLEGALGWQSADGTTPAAGGTTLVLESTAAPLTIGGYPVVQDKTEPAWSVKTEDGISYIAGTALYIGTSYLNQPSEASRLTLSLKARNAGDTARTLEVIIVYGDDLEQAATDFSVPSGNAWTDFSWTTNESISGIVSVVLSSTDAETELDIAQLSLTEMKLTESSIEQTANRISLSVTESNNEKLKRAGIDIDAETVTISAAHTLIEDENGNPVAAFEGGKLKTAFLDLGNLNLSSDDIPMMKELTPTIDYEAVTNVSNSVQLSGTNGTKSTQTLTFSHATFTADTASHHVYFSARASNNSSLWLKITAIAVTASYEIKVNDDVWSVVEDTPVEDMGNGNYRLTATNTIRNLKVTMTVNTLISVESSREVSGTLTMTVGGYQGGDSIALVPTANTTTLTETVIGANGFASIWNSNFIFHLQANDRTYTDDSGVAYSQPAGCTIMAGDYGWRITASGIQQTSDRGLNWH